jgi:hypothetical protein
MNTKSSLILASLGDKNTEEVNKTLETGRTVESERIILQCKQHIKLWTIVRSGHLSIHVQKNIIVPHRSEDFFSFFPLM